MSTTSWSKFDTYREMKILSEGRILVIRPSDASTVVPLFCPLCKFPLKTADDSIAFRKAECCDKFLLFCRGKKEETKPEQWEDYLEDRRTAPHPLFTFK